jgi:hypothetical protein
MNQSIASASVHFAMQTIHSCTYKHEVTRDSEMKSEYLISFLKNGYLSISKDKI